ncbi:MAG: hypothetical protein WCK03_03055 [Candidatus Taylorbacteria bacterium]
MILFTTTANAETTYVGATIDQVYYHKIEASKYTCVEASRELSLTESLLASVGIITKNKLIAQMSCANWSGSGGMVYLGIDSSYTLTPYIELGLREFVGAVGDESYSRTDTTTTAPRYGSQTCVRTHTYKNYPIKNHGTSGGKITNSCDKSLPSYSVNYPPYISVNNAKGSYTARWKSSNVIEDFTVREDSRSVLTFNGLSSHTYNIIINASAQQLILNTKTNMFEYKDIPCKSIRVNGNVLNSSCQTTLRVTGPVATVDVTPIASVPYYFYSVSNNTPEEMITR